jgi:Xaa-Pro dipeptidase
VWSSAPGDLEETLGVYNIDEVRCLTGLTAASAMLASMRIAVVYNLPNQVSSGVKLNPEKADAVLHKTVIGTCRVVKDEHEVAMIQKANHISSLEHEVVMCPIQDSSNEMQAGSIFKAVLSSTARRRWLTRLWQLQVRLWRH